MTPVTLVLIAKRPVPGRVKTRLVPPLTSDEAATVAAAALRDTMAVLDATPATRRVLAFDGDPCGWAAPGWDVVPQPEGGLDERLVAAFGAVSGPALLVGMDTPQLRPEHLSAFDAVRHDAALGRAPDGGYWALGLADPACAAVAIRGVPMSTAHTADVQLARLRALGLGVQLLRSLTDVDTMTDAHAVAALAPDSRFAAALAATRAPAA